MILSDLVKYLIKRSIARSVCDSWASCCQYNDLTNGFNNATTNHTRTWLLGIINGRIKTAEQRTIIMVIGTVAVDGWAITFGGAWAGCGNVSPLLAVPYVTAHPSTACVPTSCYSMWHYNYHCPLRVEAYVPTITVDHLACSTEAVLHI